MDKSNPLNDGIPSVCDVILERIQQHVAFRPDQMTVNEYKPGQGRKKLLTLSFPHPSPYTSFFTLHFHSTCFLFIFMNKTNHGRGFHNQNGSSHHNVVESGVLSLMCKSFFLRFLNGL